MRKYFFLFLLLFFPYLLSANPVTNVRAMQEGKNIVVLYDLSEDTYVSKIIIEVDGKSRVIPNKFLKGDVNKDLIAGSNKRVEYDVLADYVDGFKSDNVVFEVQISKYEAVDLGLSVKWATCNVGATKPEEYGDYFAWGETEPKTKYDWSTYKYGTDKDQLTKYCNNSKYGKNSFIDYKTRLDPEDDAATANWGGTWRMPTAGEVNELMKKCKWILIKQNGVKGCKVTGPNGNSIFLPFGSYWSNSNRWGAPEPCLARIIHMYTTIYTGDFGVDVCKASRCYDHLVRPVCLIRRKK